MDGNNQIIPIATGVAQGETNESWSWFLSKLKDCIGEVPNLTIISDRHYAITHACKNVFPNSFHAYCCRHLMMNCNMQSDKLNGLYWKTCKAYTIPEFEKLISLIRCVRPDAHKKLVEAGFSKWSRALCPTTRYNYMTSNNVESVKALTKDVRKLPITMLMDWYRDLLQKWYHERRDKHEADKAPEAPFQVNGKTYEKGYYLADGIYPQWATFVKSFTIARDLKTQKFKRVQESARKDIERAFGVVDQKFDISEYWSMYASPESNIQRTWVERCERQRMKNKELRDRRVHEDLRQDIMDHLWNLNDGI
ncbi:transposase, MuDR, MULE transposase domain protein [Tanacetum coccineum]